MAEELLMVHPRLPKSLKEALAESAQKSNRTLNAEIVQRLEDSFLYHPKEDDKELIERVKQEIVQQLKDEGLVYKP